MWRPAESEGTNHLSILRRKNNAWSELNRKTFFSSRVVKITKSVLAEICFGVLDKSRNAFFLLCYGTQEKKTKTKQRWLLIKQTDNSLWKFPVVRVHQTAVGLQCSLGLKGCDTDLAF